MKFRKILFVLLFPVFLLNFCQQPSTTETPTTSEKIIPAPKPGFIHTVFFWLKKEVTASDKIFFEGEMEKLTKVSSIQSVYWGPPAMTPREVVDNSYDYAWVVHFANQADQDNYQADQIHKDFIAACEHLWEKVQVYDNLVR